MIYWPLKRGAEEKRNDRVKDAGEREVRQSVLRRKRLRALTTTAGRE